ncbi:MupA/Atu3671 family FMN-dependent luciferase-like monooxygenase [Pseudosulfitobacter sp. DSM 107133]|uniref:MupA/Atu3671 family FMN-dependent luciferase-like monooxygenase n=1 Tax=Pseudosulfitobacter sp. DSM 107133 TaxID=2883100 RepID=UPI000DF2C7A3|nr:MupA/Atu3671 family FMN-dependent luciferase-like monooxygenase [Pseudosulfitobacter sp. DSM 107133]UOA26822.1 Dimodular nonribosomal peptide synthase [Pseudosulfitobacter sp. DSM 107133]
MSLFSCVLIGDESLTIACGARLIERGADIRAVATRDADVARWAEGAGLTVTQRIADLPTLVQDGIDWVLSIANLRIVPKAVLDWPARGAVNFHDGPLPDYAGINTPVWAILNRRKSHGVTWHFMTSGIDEGDIILSRAFDMPRDVTAHALNARCYAEGLDSFGAVLDELAAPDPQRMAQDFSTRQLFTRAQLPPAAGYIDFDSTVQDARALVSALDFASHANPVACARIRLDGAAVQVRRAEPAEGQGAPGLVVAVGEGRLTVMCADGALRLSGLSRMDGRTPRIDVVAGDTLERPDVDLDAIASLAKHEDHWRALLSTAKPLAVPLAGGATGAADWQSREIASPAGLERDTALERIARWAAQGAGAAGYMAYRNRALAALAAKAPHEIADWLPLRSDAALEDAAEAANRPGMAADLGLRLAGGPGLERPAMGICEDGTPVEGTAVSVLWPEGRLMFDATRISPAAADLLAARLAETLAGSTRAVSQADAALQAIWHGTPAQPAGALTVHGAITAQAKRTPEAQALVFEDTILTYAALEARADAVAAALQGAGVTKGTHVALCLSRGPDLVIGALGILKAGGAYVPLDPDYPAARLAHAITDSQAPIVLTEAALENTLPQTGARLMRIADCAQSHAPVQDVAGLDDTAYLIYTSGSTGTPKGVRVSHGNVANFRAGMDEHIDADAGGVWLAVTSIAFDISVLELWHTLARGFKVVLSGGETRAAVSGTSQMGGTSRGGLKFGLYYWGNDGGVTADKYHLLLEGAKFADANGFTSLWTPERHFHAFGGSYPNPAVTGAAVAAVTRNLDVRAGSCVAPLHHPARIAEEWAVIDNLTGGRAGIAFASGWQPDDFVLRPENTPPANKPALYSTLEQVRALWRGEEVSFATQSGAPHSVMTYPRPVQAELPVWVTTAGNPDTWREAGALGAHVLTHLLGQTIEEVRGKIEIYHEALRGAGHNPADFQVTMMLHSYLADTREAAREVARGPMKDYLRSAAGLIKQYAWAFPAFKKPAGVASPMQIDLAGLAEDEMEAILDFAFERYFEDAGLFGTVDDGLARAEQLAGIGVTEIACLIDYGIDAATVLEGLRPLAEVLRRANAPDVLDADDFSLAAQIVRHGVTHLQCTPSMARILTMNPEARSALGRVRHLYLGGEALPGDLVDEVRRATPARILNMYGPTETTIWSTVQPVEGPVNGTAPIGAPIVGTVCHVLDETGAPVPIGVPGQLWIGGAGVTQGYWQRPELTAERFRALSGLAGGTLYDTGDLAAWRADGTLDFIGRDDGQIKIRGHRIELGEIEAHMAAFAGITGAVVTATGTGKDVRLTGYFTANAPIDAEALRQHLAHSMPPAMVPAALVALEAFPLTPNKKIDRASLPMAARPQAKVLSTPQAQTRALPITTGAASTAVPEDLMNRISAIWCNVLGVAEVRADDNFFALGGHSLLAVQMHRDIRAVLPDVKLSIADVFRFPVLADLAAHLGGPSNTDAVPTPAAIGARDEVMERRRAMRAARRGGAT